MIITMWRRGAVAAAAAAITAGVSVALSMPVRAAQPTADAAGVDKVFARWTSQSTPGCAAGVSVDDRPVLTRAYGMADLEHDARNTPETIFEAGSVSKQFTAAAVLLLARDGKLSLDDPVRKHIPELPDYGAPLTVRHMLNHSSGLRDWGSVAALAGWPRTTRAYTHAHVLDIVSRQRAVNFTPGTRYSYSNTGYNLAAILVARLSGMSFAEFSQQRLFGPLGMTSTSWRDDHQRIVRGRAMAYSDEGGRYETLMPFENVHGNGGLLTTVGDLLKWNANFTTHVVGDTAFARDQETPGRFNDGRVHGYALGLMVGTRHGLREIGHSGSTAGYRAHLTRFPDQKLSVAVLCNVSSGAATAYAEAIADLYLRSHVKPSPARPGAHTLTAAEIAAATGMFRDTTTGVIVQVTRTDGGVRLDGGSTFTAVSGNRFTTAQGDSWEVDGRGGARSTDRYGTVVMYDRASAATPSASDLQALVGTYVSDDAETTLRVALESGELVVKRRPDATIRLTPLYKDAFSGLGTVVFRRDTAGRVLTLSVVQDRVWDMPFRRVETAAETARRGGGTR